MNSRGGIEAEGALIPIPAALKVVKHSHSRRGYSLTREAVLTSRVGKFGHPCLVKFLRLFL